MTTKAQHTGASLAEIIIVVLIVIAVNWLAYTFFFRADMTENRVYTISDATKQVLASLDDQVTAEFFISNDLPPQFRSIKDDIISKLEEFTAYGQGNFKIRYTDPADDQEARERAASLGVNEFEAQVLSQDQVSVQKVFMGIVLHYEDKSETIPMAVEPSVLEYELTSNIMRMTLEEKPKIALFAGPFVAGQQQQQAPSFAGIQQVLGGAEGFYEVIQLNPENDKELPPDVDAVIVMGAFGMGESLKYSIDQFLLGGGQVVVALDPMMEMAQQQGGMEAQAYPSLPTIEDQLTNYGVRFDKKLIVDEQSANASFRSGFMTVIQPYPLWPKVGPQGFNEDVAAVAQLESLVLPWCCPLLDEGTANVKFATLATTSQRSFVLSSPFDLNPQQDWAFKRTASESEGPYKIATMLTGAFPTAFESGPPEVSPPAGDGTGPEAGAPVFDPAQQLKEGSGEGRLIVMSSARGFSDQLLQRFPENILFMANVVDMLVLGEELLGIRSTPVTERPLKQLTDAQRSMVRWLNVLGVPMLLVLLGLLLWFIKGRQRAALQRRYGG